MEKRLLLLLLGIVTLFCTNGCATIISGTTQPVTLSSSPDGATVTVSGQVIGKTPTTINLERKSKQVVEFDKEGYTKQKVQLDTKFNPWVLANVIFCFSCVFSTTTDYASGAAYEYMPYHYYVTLIPVGSQATTSDAKKNKAKAFIIGYYSHILSELSTTAPGESLKTLYTILEISEPDSKQAFEKIKAISSRTEKDTLKFADEVINAFIPEATKKE